MTHELEPDPEYQLLVEFVRAVSEDAPSDPARLLDLLVRSEDLDALLVQLVNDAL